jgi:hypothetical protein
MLIANVNDYIVRLTNRAIQSCNPPRNFSVDKIVTVSDLPALLSYPFEARVQSSLGFSSRYQRAEKKEGRNEGMKEGRSDGRNDGRKEEREWGRNIDWIGCNSRKRNGEEK